MVRKDTATTYVFEYQSVSDVYDTFEREPANSQYRRYTDSYNDRRFTGIESGSDFEGLKYSWENGIRKLMELPELSGTGRTASVQKTWSEEDGDDGDYERYLNELPFLHKRKKVFGNGRNRIAHLIFNIGENCDIRAESMLWKAYAAARIVDCLESAGQRVEITIVHRSVNLTRARKNEQYTTITAKHAEEPLNLGLLCTVLSPWFFRHWLLGYNGKVVTNINSGHGRTAPVLTDRHPEGAIVIDKGQCLSREAAEQFIKALDI